MNGFGLLNNIDAMKKVTTEVSEKDLVNMNPLSEAQEKELNKVTVVDIDTDEYKASGSAGNTPDPSLDKEKEAQLGAAEGDDEDAQMDGLGGCNIGGGIRKEMARTESFEGDEVTDEEPMDEAKERTTENVMDKVKDIFEDMFGKTYQEKAKEKDYDLDMTNPSVTIEEPPQMKRIKKGW